MIVDVVFDQIVDLALREDLCGGDLTTEATVPAGTQAIARAIARAELVVCGAQVFKRVFERVDPELRFAQLVPEGKLVSAGTRLWTIQGSARAILLAERTALNFVQRMSGIATLARTYVQALPPDSGTRIADTRKTSPGMRGLERYAVRVGGAFNHRDSLSSAVLIKDNHIEAAGGVTQALKSARRRAPHTTKVEVEVTNLSQLEEALVGGADIVMLDNFTPETIDHAVQFAKGRALVEVSGGVTLERIASLAAAGVDVISVGALTHSAPSADIALDIERIADSRH